LNFFLFPLQKNNKEKMGKSQWKNENECWITKGIVVVRIKFFFSTVRFNGESERGIRQARKEKGFFLFDPVLNWLGNCHFNFWWFWIFFIDFRWLFRESCEHEIWLFFEKISRIFLVYSLIH
jgi:hypothetical protein